MHCPRFCSRERTLYIHLCQRWLCNRRRGRWIIEVHGGGRNSGGARQQLNSAGLIRGNGQQQAPPESVLLFRHLMLFTMATVNAAIDSLPCELLIEIFIACACADPLSPLVLEQVCRQWTDVANTTPHVWQHISLDDWKCSLPMLHMQTERWLRRSSPLPFDVHIHLFAIDNLLPLLAPFLPYINRWRSISITGAREESVSLRDLHIESLDYLIIGIEADPKQTFATASPLVPGSSSIEVGLTSLPTIHTISNLHFTTISIIEHSIEAQSTPTSLVNFLRTCPNLQVRSLASQ